MCVCECVCVCVYNILYMKYNVVQHIIQQHIPSQYFVVKTPMVIIEAAGNVYGWGVNCYIGHQFMNKIM